MTSTTGDRPLRLSIVVTARNDDHGGGMLRRMQIFLDAFFEQARRRGLNGELIIVEWNPPPDRPRLADALRWPEAPGACGVRIVEVSPEIHRRFRHADGLGLFQMIAKNAAIRRARGRFILATNVDLLFSDALMRFLASERLDDRCIYRTDRIDVSPDIPLGVPVSEQLEYCRRHVLKVNSRWGTFAHGDGPPLVPGRVYAVLRWARLSWRHLRQPLHTNACGDFTILSADRWFAIRGYPELKMYSLHMDAILCRMAVAAGAREVVLGGKMRLYHLEHGLGWGDAANLAARMAAKGVPILDYQQYLIWANEAKRRGGPILFNDEKWGLADERLPEFDPIPRTRANVIPVVEGVRT